MLRWVRSFLGGHRIVTAQADGPALGVIRPVWSSGNFYLDGLALEFYHREAILLAATGGRVESDSLASWQDGELLIRPDALFRTLDGVLSHGAVPRVVVTIPTALSGTAPGFSYANPLPPRDWDSYSDYCRRLFGALLERYSLERMRTWSFRLLSEPDNREHWQGTREEYLHLHERTVAAVRAGFPDFRLDFGNFQHPSRHWDSGSGLAISGYGSLCGESQLGADPRNLARLVASLRASLHDRPISVEEGMLLRDEEGRRLWAGEATELGAAWHAGVYQVCLDMNVQRYLSWGFRCGGLQSPTYNLIQMLETMVGHERLPCQSEGTNGHFYADTLLARAPDGSLRALLFHYNPDRSSRYPLTFRLHVSGMRRGAYIRRHWRIDRSHSNFFSRWLKDSAHLQRSAQPVSNLEDWGGSRYDLLVPSSLAPADQAYWFGKQSSYEGQDALQRNEPDRTVTLGLRGWVDKVRLQGNCVSLLELIPR